MPGNANLHASRRARQDEFYTQLETIEDELRHYRDHFKGKVVFCNADDPAMGTGGADHFGDGAGGYVSNFYRYFTLNFAHLGLGRLITTHYEPGRPSYRLEVGSANAAGEAVLETYPLKGDGDFRSDECMALLDQCDIVVTNPPFSLMKEYLPTLVNSGKKFLVLGNLNHAMHKELFPYFLTGKCWLGRNSGHFWFRVPDYFEPKDTDYKQDEDGQKWRRMGGMCWFTNMDFAQRHEPLDLYRTYSPNRYPKYDTYDAIDVGRYSEIPTDYDGVMGVPITYLANHCPEQFDIVGEFKHGIDGDFDLAAPILGGVEKFVRVAIRRRQDGNVMAHE